MQTKEYIAKTTHGLEEVLGKEIADLGATVTGFHRRAVSFEATKKQLYQANLHLRTALRILQPIHGFPANTEEQLYRGVGKIDWSKYLTLDETFAVSSAVSSEYFQHSQYAALKTKDAIVDQFRDKTGKRPSIDTRDPDLRIHLHIRGEECTILLDSSGESLHRRGYRTEANKAPLNEVLAAGMIMLSGWEGQSNFVDPMCGSGTILIEAALIASRFAPGLLRKKFGFQNWKNYDEALWEECVAEAEAQIIKFDAFEINGSDHHRPTVQIARNNIARAKMEEVIRISGQSFEEKKPPSSPGVMIINPPYGERMVEAQITQFYKMIGDQLKQQYDGYDAWIISSNKDAMKRVGLRTSKRLTLFNGPLECKFHLFKMYK